MSEITVIRNIMIPMRDGVRLACDLYRPETEERLPAVLMRLPYVKEKFANEWLYSDYETLVRRGYNVVIQDVRGTGHSEGVLLSSGGNEADDGYDTIEWIAQQDWCDGNVGMYGLSYFGYTQMAAADRVPPHLKAICPFQNSAIHPLSVTKAITLNVYHLGWLYGRVLDSLPDRKDINEEQKEQIREKIRYYQEHWGEVMSQLPIRDTPAARIENVPLLNDFLDLVDGVADPEYWKRSHRPVAFDRIQVPMFYLTGWFDAACNDTIDNYQKMKTDCAPEIVKESRLVIGPWQHGGMLKTDIDGYDFGEENTGASMGIQEAMYDWFDRWLKGAHKEPVPHVLYYTIHKNAWETASDWPPADAVYKKLYIHAKEEGESGRLNEQIPMKEEGTETFSYDPADPYPSSFEDQKGHRILADSSCLGNRPDTLVYHTLPLEESLRITGCVFFRLYAKTSAEDTDFVCRLSDCSEDGSAFPLVHGIVRARYRHGILEEPIVPNEIYEYDIDMGNISCEVPAGHCLRVEITSSCYPEYDRSLNTLERIGYGTEMKIAEQTICHDEEHPSHLILPVR